MYLYRGLWKCIFYPCTLRQIDVNWWWSGWMNIHAVWHYAWANMSSLGICPLRWKQIFRKKRNSSVLGTETSFYIYYWNNIYGKKKALFSCYMSKFMVFIFIFWLIKVQIFLLICITKANKNTLPDMFKRLVSHRWGKN